MMSAMAMVLYWSTRQLWILIMSAIVFFVTYSKAGVILTVEEGGSLIGPHCPGTVRLLCEGVDLASLRWRYNGNIPVISFFPDGSPTTQPEHLNYFRAHLITAHQNPADRNLGNISSSLTVEASQLQRNRVTAISCSDPTRFDNVLVNISIIPPSIAIIRVNAMYSNGALINITVTWMKLNNSCDDSVTYEVNLSNCNESGNSPSCNEDLCEINFNNITGKTDEISIFVEARYQSEGTSDTVTYPIKVAPRVVAYFVPNLFVSNLQLMGRCTLTAGFIGNTTCTVQYTTDSMYRNLSKGATYPFDTEFLVLEGPNFEVTYYFLFTVLINSTLQVTDLRYFKQTDLPGFPGWGVALIAIFFVPACVTTALAIGIILLMKIKAKGKDTSFCQSSASIDNKDMVELDDQQSLTKSSSIQALPVVAGNQVQSETPTTFNDTTESQQDTVTPVKEDDLIDSEQWVNVDSVVQTEINKTTESQPISVKWLTVSVVDSDTRTEIVTGITGKLACKPYTVYQVKVNIKDEKNTEIVVYRRYREFNQLLKELNVPERTKLKFPGKQYGNLDESRIKQRQAKLNDFMDDLVKIPNFHKLRPAINFLGLDDYYIEEGQECFRV